MAVSDGQSSGVGETGRPSQVVGETPELAVSWGCRVSRSRDAVLRRGDRLEECAQESILPTHIRTLLYLRAPSFLVFCAEAEDSGLLLSFLTTAS